MAWMPQGVPCAKHSVSMPLPSVASLTAWCHTDCPYKPGTAALPSSECHLLCSTAQHPAPRTESETQVVSKGCSLLATGLPAKQAVLLQPSGTTLSTSSKDPAFAAPERTLSVLVANAEAGLRKRQAGKLGAPESSVGCRATKVAGTLSLEASSLWFNHFRTQSFKYEKRKMKQNKNKTAIKSVHDPLTLLFQFKLQRERFNQYRLVEISLNHSSSSKSFKLLQILDVVFIGSRNLPS